MRVFILGISMFVTGFIGFAIMCGSTISSTFTINNSNNWWVIMRFFGVAPIAIGFLILGIIGFVIAMVGLCKQ